MSLSSKLSIFGKAQSLGKNGAPNVSMQIERMDANEGLHALTQSVPPLLGDHNFRFHTFGCFLECRTTWFASVLEPPVHKYRKGGGENVAAPEMCIHRQVVLLGSSFPCVAAIVAPGGAGRPEGGQWWVQDLSLWGRGKFYLFVSHLSSRKAGGGGTHKPNGKC